MDLDRLNEFILTARRKSLRKAAEAMNIAPATLNARLCSLEASLGTALFEKSRSTLSLTPKGARFYRDACEIIDEYAQLKKSLTDCSHRSQRPLRIAAAGGIIPFYLTAFLSLLEAQNPGFPLEMTDDTCCSVSDGLLSGQVDFYFAPVMQQPKYEEIMCLPIVACRPQLLLPRNHRLSSRGSLSMKELDNECFVLYPVTRDTCIRNFQLANLKAAGISWSAYDSHSLPLFNQTFTAIGKGIFISPIPIPDSLSDSVHIPLTDIPRPATETLFYRKDTGDTDITLLITQFKQHLKETFGHENRKAL